MYNESIMKKPKIMCLIMLIGVMILTMQICIPAKAFAVTGLPTTTSDTDLPTNYVSLQRFDLKDADSFTSTNPNVQITDQWIHAATGHTPPVYTFDRALYYKGPLNWGTANRTKDEDAKLKANRISGEFTFRWNNIARLTDNTTADLVLVLSDWVYSVGELPDEVKNPDRDMYVVLAGNNLGTNIMACPPRKGFSNTDAVGVSTTTSVKMTFKVMKHGTDTPIDAEKYPTMRFGVVDLDQPDASIAGSKTDAKKYAGQYSEGVGLLSGFVGPIQLTPGSLEKIDVVDGNQKIRGTVEDDTNSLISGFAAGVQPQEFSFIWYGSSGVNHATQNEEGAPAGRGIGTKFQPYSEIVADSVNVSYQWDGEHPDIAVPAGATQEIGSDYTVDTTFKPGDKLQDSGREWTFQGWDKNGTIVLNEDTVIRGTWKYENRYNVTYEWDGDHPDKPLPKGQKDIISGTEYAVDTSYITGDSIEEEKGIWTFLGWDHSGTITIDRDFVIKGMWKFDPYHKITTEVVNGSITEEQKKILPGEDRTVKYSPDDGCQLVSITVDGDIISAEEHTAEYLFSAVQKDHHIKVVYEKIPALEISKTADKDVYNAGDTVTYTVSVRQTVKDAEARDVKITDQLPEGLTLIRDSIAGEGITIVDQQEQSYELQVPILSDGITYTYQAATQEKADAEELINSVEAKAGNTPEPVRDTARVKALTPKPVIEKTVSEEHPLYRDEITYTIRVSEPQDGIVLRNAVVKDAIPEGLTYVPDSAVTEGDEAEVTASDGIVAVSIPSLSNETVIRFRAVVNMMNGTADNIAVLTGDGIDEIRDDAKIKIREPQPALVKTVSKDNIKVGDTVTYTLKAGSDIPLIQAIIKDAPPQGVEILSDSVKCSAEDVYLTTEENILTAAFERLEGDVIITYDAVVKTSGEFVNTATLSASNFPEGPLEAHATVTASEKKDSPEDQDGDIPAKITKGSTPKTGDTSHILLAIALLLISAEAAYFAVITRRARKTEEDPTTEE